MPVSGKAARSRDLIAWMLHLTVYTVLLLAYFLLVLRYLAAWFLGLFQHHRVEYALFGIILMIVQAVALETVSGFILRLFHLGDKK
jgi:Kef-type K+ transport system membrane component KefB